MSRFTEAETELREVVRLDPNSAQAYTNLGNLARLRGDLASAAKQYRLALEKDPSLDKPRLGLGLVLGAGGDLTGARRQFEQAARSSDESVRREAQGALQKIDSLLEHGKSGSPSR